MNSMLVPHRSRYGLWLVPVLAALLFVSALTTPVGAEPWLGTVEVEGSVRHIRNPESPLHGREVLQPDELWRLDGSDEDAVFGVIYHAVADAAGDVYLLDYQQKRVMVVDPVGTVWRFLGREGDGPGEFVRVKDVFVDDEGRVGILQNAPGKIEMFDTSSQPLGQVPLPEYGNASLLKLRSVGYAAGRIYTVLLNRVRAENGDGIAHNALWALAGPGGEAVQFDEVILYRDYADAHYTEQERSRGEPWTWTVGPTGRVFTNQDFDSYRISVYEPDGAPAHVIHREYEPRLRAADDVARWQAAWDKDFEGRFIGGSPMTYEVCRTDPAVELLFAREDGSLWVLSSRGAYDAPEGALGVFDVFDRDGRWDRQVVVMGEGDFRHDRFFISKGLLVVVRNVSSEASDDDEERKYEVICYRM